MTAATYDIDCIGVSFAMRLAVIIFSSLFRPGQAQVFDEIN